MQFGQGAVLQNSSTPSLRVAGFEDEDDDEDSLPDEALPSSVGSSVSKRSRENETLHAVGVLFTRYLQEKDHRSDEKQQTDPGQDLYPRLTQNAQPIGLIRHTGVVRECWAVWI